MRQLRVAWKAFGKHLKAYREAKELGLREASRILQVGHATWCRAEQGKPIEPATFLYLTDWIGMDAKEYLAPLYTKEH